MFRLLAKIFFFLIVVLIVSAIAIGVFYWGYRDHYLSRHLTGVFGAPVSVENIHYKNNDWLIEKVAVFNPQEDKLEKAFYAPLIRINAQPKKLVSKDVVIEEVVVSDAYIGIVLYSADGEQNNWSALLHRLQRDDESDSQTTYQIKRLVMTNVSIKVFNAVTGETITPDPIPRIEIQSIGVDRPSTSKKLMAIVMEAVIREATRQRGLNSVLKTVNPLTPAKMLIIPFIGQ